ncbi:hypothetical protein KHC28_20675 [Ancylobacter sonchi]|uniref:hypothetical protein n=1 Tax=Ancylobacter sonchi TaxID=1937790 RepID=UPI001BD4DE33|nr:hypothetical protein [Ancylobacter sonchi]MBS7536072.1 hypothetical protein [Ancylobacter sonchi]
MYFSRAARRHAEPRRSDAVLLAAGLAGSLAILSALAAGPAAAGSNVIGLSVASERVPDDFSDTKSTDWQLSYAHTFDNNVSLGGSAKYYDTAHTSAYAWNVEGTVGYTHALNEAWSVGGVAALGSHMPSGATDFPYYSFTGSLSVKLSPVVTWTVIAARYRNAFDTDYGYETPELGTQLDFRLSDAHSVSVKLERDWKNGDVSYNAIELGYKYHF